MDAQRVGLNVNHSTVGRVDEPLACESYRALRGCIRLPDHAASRTARNERPVLLVSPVGKCFGDDVKTRTAAGREQLGASQTNERQLTVHCAHGAGDGVRKGRVGRSRVVERAVRLDVSEDEPLGARDAGECGDLIEDEILELSGRKAHRAATETLAIRVRGVRAERETEGTGCANRAADNGRITRVDAAGNID